MKVNVSMDDELMARLDAHASESYMSRSGLISLACMQYLSSKEVTKALVNLSISMQKIADQGTVDDETMKELEDFERMTKMLLSGMR